MPFLRWLRDDEQHFAIIVDADPAKFESRELRPEVGPEPVLQLVSLDTTGNAWCGVLLHADHQDGAAPEVALGLLRPAVCRAQQELCDLRHACLAAEIQAALDLQVGRLGLVPDGQDVIQDESQGAFTEGESAGIQLHRRHPLEAEHA